MALYARVENGIAVELIDTGDYAITQLYAPSFVESMVQVPEGAEVEIGAPLGDIRRAAEPAPASVASVPVAPAITEEPSRAQEKAWRESVLADTQWLMARHRDEQELGRAPTLAAPQYLALLQYRQALRDWPGAGATQRPAAPPWLGADGG
ncbi:MULTISPECIES: hypothetical protein [unclassified Pseudomonas]|uniref:hypothetical protein n=1 Tax=unclassified Pseudomonas TaxID=196821 RepID=UPI000A1F4FB7|nr:MULTISPECIES: hypothetical protein [unclassified Pseudomonas]